ncbi:hypothetical protein HK103_005601 [Boothiomyces macroporosus]|uniref:UspA domain-containing protein n=1 Tax=Boothiomyces macroporosus TaxID=261099 RepID=A0AAD5UIR0_9FUNG|nr:hypothetical protein HK103_005601 [Boothiomyces macroporosus]
MKHVVNIKHLKDQETCRTVVLPLDSSEFSKHALEWSKKHLLCEKDKVILVNIRSVSETVKESITGDKDSDQQQQLMECYCSDLKDYSVEYFVGVGDLKSDLCEFIDTLKGDLVVVGQQDESMSKTLWGSVSTYLAKHSKDSILIVKKRDHK